MRSYNLPLPAHFTVSRHEQVIVCAGGAVEVWDPRAQVREDGAGPNAFHPSARARRMKIRRAPRATKPRTNERTDLRFCPSHRRVGTVLPFMIDVDVDVDRPPPGSAPSRRKMQMRVWCA